MRNSSLCKSSLRLAGLALALLMIVPGLAWGQIGAGALTGTNEYEGREEGETIPLDLERGSFQTDLPFDVNFKVSGKMPAGFGAGSRIDARFVEFDRPPDCASFFNQYALTTQRLSDLNDTDAIPVRRRPRARAVEQSGFRQATVFDAAGLNVQAGLLGELVRVQAQAGGGQPAVVAPIQGASFVVDFPALRPNQYYCFQFIARRALSKEDLEEVHRKFEAAVDEELRKEKYQRQSGDFTTFQVDVEDYERLRVTLAAVLEEVLAERPNQVVLAPPNSFFNVGAELSEIKARYREEFEQIAQKTVGARLIAISNLEQQIKTAVKAMQEIAKKDFEPTLDGVKVEEPISGLDLVLARKDTTEGVATFLQALRAAGLQPTELTGLTVDQLARKLRGVPVDAPLPVSDLRNLWDPGPTEGRVDTLQDRIDNLQALSASLEALIELAETAKIDLVARQVDASEIGESQVENSRKNLERLREQLEALDRRIAELKEEKSRTSSETERQTLTGQIAKLEDRRPQFVQNIAGAETSLAEQEGELQESDFEPRENLVYQAAQALAGAAEGMRQLQTLLREREELIAGWVRQVLVEEQASLLVGGSTVADYDTRAIWYMSADIGSGISDLEDFFTYVGWNIYLRPVNKKAHLSWGARPFGLREEFMRRFSFTIGVVQSGFDEVPGEFEGVIGSNAAVLGAGLRINDSLRFSVGGMLFESQDPDPLIDNTRLSWSPYVAISLDWNIGASLSGLLPGR